MMEVPFPLEEVVGYIDRNLNAGEVILFKAEIHWVVLTVPVLCAMLMGLPGAGILLFSLASEGDQNGLVGAMNGRAFFLLGSAAVLIVFGLVLRSSTEVAITNRRVYGKTGLFGARTFSVPIFEIKKVSVEENYWGSILGYGSVLVQGPGGTAQPITEIVRPQEFRRHIQETVAMRQQEAL